MSFKVSALAVALGLVAFASAFPSTTLVDIKQPDYQVSVKYNNGNAVEEPEVVTTTEALVTEKQADTPAAKEQQAEEIVEETMVTEAAPSAEPAAAAPSMTSTSSESADHAMQHQVTNLANGAVRYAYQGQTQHNDQSSSRVSHSLVRNGPPSPPAPEQPFHQVDLLPATQRGQVLAYHAGVSSTNAVTFQHLQPLPSLSPAEARLFREQIFTVNVAAPKYGYGYTVRGIERPQE